MLLCTLVAGCSEHATLPDTAGTGLNPPFLRQPDAHSDGKHRPGGRVAGGQVPDGGSRIGRECVCDGLDHPRWLYVLPNGDVLVAETNAPPRPEDSKGIRAWFMKRAMKDAGAGVPSANRITLLRDADGDGAAELRTAFIEGLNSPFGMVLVGQDFYVANTDAVVRFPYHDGDTRIAGPVSASPSCRAARATITGPRT
jgi:glucose/arabinose dehydrogenase